MSDAGYARLHRSLLGHSVFRNDAEAMAFGWLVLRAAWRPYSVRYKDRCISLARGQLSVSVRDFAHAMDRDKGWCERLLKRLVAQDMVKTVSETGVMVVTICNYDKFQAEAEDAETGGERRPKTGARQARDTEQGREKGKKEEGSGAKAPSARVARPDDVGAIVWLDFLKLRDKKRAAVTVTALAGIRREVAKIPGMTMEAALAECCERGWQGFKAEWHEQESGNGRSNGRTGGGSGAGKGDGFANALAEWRAIGEADDPFAPDERGMRNVTPVGRDESG